MVVKSVIPKNPNIVLKYLSPISFIEAYKQSHPEDEIITLDLYEENIGLLSEDDINTVFGPKTDESKKQPILKYAYQV